MGDYKPETCGKCAWSFESYVYGKKILCALTEEYGCIEDVDRIPDWCPLKGDKRSLDDTKPSMI